MPIFRYYPILCASDSTAAKNGLGKAMARKFALILCAGLLVGACANQGEFPSLAPRAVEQPRAASGSAPVVTPSDPAMLAKLQASVAMARAAEPEFGQALAVAKDAAAKAGAFGSDSWVAAQIAIARLERTREPIQISLSDLTDQQRLALLGSSNEDRAAVAASIAEVASINDTQGRAVQALLSSLSRR